MRILNYNEIECASGGEADVNKLAVKIGAAVLGFSTLILGFILFSKYQNPTSTPY